MVFDKMSNFPRLDSLSGAGSFVFAGPCSLHGQCFFVAFALHKFAG